MSVMLDAGARPALFGTLERQPPDALLAVIGMHRADPRPHKIERNAIYMPGSGRINIAGLRTETVRPFVTALEPYLYNA